MCDVRLTKIQKFCTKDGPGVRTTVFFMGCPLRCEWCHNPETQAVKPQLMFADNLCIGCGACAAVCTKGAHVNREGVHCIDRDVCESCGACADVCPAGACEMSGISSNVAKIMAEVEKDRVFYGRDGGLTVSGGEPMAQPEACIALLKAAKAAGINTAVETCGHFDKKWIEELVDCTELFLWDVKDTDTERHRKHTGQGNGLILDNLHAADALGGKTRLRCIMVEGVNMDDKHLDAVAEIFKGLKNCEGIELIPYHAYGSSKAVQLGRKDNAERSRIPSEERMLRAAERLAKQGAKVLVH